MTRTGGDSRPVVGDVVSLVFGLEVLETGAECGGEAESGCTGLVVDVERERERGRDAETGGAVDWERDLDRGGERFWHWVSRSEERVKKRILMVL